MVTTHAESLHAVSSTTGGPMVYQRQLYPVLRDTRSACVCAIDLREWLLVSRSDISNPNPPTCSFPLNTYNLHPSNGFLASGGSWYFSTTSLPSPVLTVLVAAANNPELPKLGFALSSSLSLSPPSSPSTRLDPDLERERDRLLLEGDLDLESLSFRDDLDGGEADLRAPRFESEFLSRLSNPRSSRSRRSRSWCSPSLSLLRSRSVRSRWWLERFVREEYAGGELGR